ncbi:MAG TPA: M28 family peptidase [Thermoleophilia bacterium]|nr:M28 family peptidase [Thermoleophilia bacterium]
MYRVAWVVAAVLVVVALFTLKSPDTPRLSQEPPSFDGDAAYADLKTIVEDFPQRMAGTDPDSRMAIWVEQQFRAAGLETHIDNFAATVNGKVVALQNVYGIAKGRTRGTILLLANRDIAPLATQGAGDNASGVAALIELADAFTVAAHDHTLVFLCTTGDSFGALGARDFAERHQTDDLYAAIALRDVAKLRSDAVALDGWSAVPKAAPPWLWLLAAPAAKRDSNMGAHLPSAPSQVLRLAVPTDAGSQGPFVAAGVPAITVSAAGPSAPARSDTIDSVSEGTLTEVGTTVQNMVMAVDGTAAPGARSGGTIFLTHRATLPGGALAAILAALALPLVAVTVDLYAHCRRTRIRLKPAFQRAGLHLAPWLVLIGIVYFANLVGLLPHSPDAVIPPDSHMAASPRYLRVVILVVLLVIAYAYAVAVERRLERRFATDARATIFVSHLVLVAIALLLLLVNPYAILVVLPAAILWPLARPGGWMRSILPAYLGLVMVAVPLLYYAAQLDVGWKVWWYFFLLFENRTIPAGMTLLAVLFFSTAGVLAHTLHERGLAPGALSWPAVDRRRPDRPSDEEWETAELAAGRTPRRDRRPARAQRDVRDERRRRELRRRRRPPGG